jgi:outer membrane protein OmpA-like peptidoglycan-associated protein
MNEIDAATEQIEHRIANLGKYRVADLATVVFNFNSDALTADAMSDLDQNVVSAVSGREGGYLIELQGFTDNIGTEKYNLNLSDRRVESVLRHLVSNGVPLSRISLVGLGKADPVADNQSPAGRKQNRRVEIRVLRSSETTTAAR